MRLLGSLLSGPLLAGLLFREREGERERRRKRMEPLALVVSWGARQVEQACWSVYR